MNLSLRSIRRSRGVRRNDGFTLGEVLASAAIIIVALVGLLSSTAIGLGHIDNARRSSVALFLANRRAEAIKTFALSTATGQGYSNVTTTNFPAEAYGTITINGTGYARYRTTTAITNDPGGTTSTKLVTVTAFYKSGGVGNEASVQVSTLLANR